VNLPVGLPLFDATASEDGKERGIDAARGSLASWNLHLLEAARGVARILARRNGTVTADDVVKHFADEGINLTAKLGNAMGGLFKGAEWEFTGKYIKSVRVHAHSNLLRVWRIRREFDCKTLR
jgi:hypothetical protein